jgi:hypothetical protein
MSDQLALKHNGRTRQPVSGNATEPRVGGPELHTDAESATAVQPSGRIVRRRAASAASPTAVQPSGRIVRRAASAASANPTMGNSADSAMTPQPPAHKTSTPRTGQHGGRQIPADNDVSAGINEIQEARSTELGVDDLTRRTLSLWRGHSVDALYLSFCIVPAIDDELTPICDLIGHFLSSPLYDEWSDMWADIEAGMTNIYGPNWKRGAEHFG